MHNAASNGIGDEAGSKIELADEAAEDLTMSSTRCGHPGRGGIEPVLDKVPRLHR